MSIRSLFKFVDQHKAEVSSLIVNGTCLNTEKFISLTREPESKLSEYAQTVKEGKAILKRAKRRGR